MMKKLIVLMITLFSIGCSDAVFPDLPDKENVTEDAMVLDLDIVENDDESETDDDLSDEVLTDPDEVPDESEPVITSSLVVATVGGYDVPFSGKVLFSNDESFEGLKFVHEDKQMGSSDGADITIGDWDGGFFIIGRHDSSTVYFFNENKTKDGFDFSSADLGNGNYINLQEGIYNPFKEEFIFSAMSSNYLIILKEHTVSKLQISENANASPSKMRIIGQKLYVAMLNFKDQWLSEKGEIAVVDLESYKVETFSLPSKNPAGGIEYNGNVDKDHFYIACSGNWQKRDGALVRVNIDTMKSEKVLLESDDGGVFDGDFVDVSIADNGMFYIVFSHNNDSWINKLLKYDPKKGTVSQIDSGINAFAAKPIDFSRVTKKVYYFADSGPDTFLRSLDIITEEKNELKMEAGPAAVKIWVREQ